MIFLYIHLTQFVKTLITNFITLYAECGDQQPCSGNLQLHQAISFTIFPPHFHKSLQPLSYRKPFRPSSLTPLKRKLISFLSLPTRRRTAICFFRKPPTKSFRERFQSPTVPNPKLPNGNPVLPELIQLCRRGTFCVTDYNSSVSALLRPTSSCMA